MKKQNFLYIKPHKFFYSGIVIKKEKQNIVQKGIDSSAKDSLILHAVEGINRTLQLKEVLRECMEAAKVVMKAEASSLMLLDELTGDLNVSIPTGPVKDEIIGMAVPKDKGIGGWVVSYNQPFISNDVVESDIFWKDLSTGFTTRNIICVPLRDDTGEAFGVLQAINKKDDKPFENEEVPVFESLAHHVSIAIQRSKLFDQQESKLHERDTYISELHHRLRNTLSVISGLIEFDQEEVEDKEARRALIFANSRLRTLAKAHAILFEDELKNEMILGNYLIKIAQSVEILFEEQNKEIFISTRLEEVKLDSNRSILCGLIVNELLMNLFEYAFRERNEGEILLTVKMPSRDKVVIMITDNGSGTENIPDVSKSRPTARYILRSLASKLNGEISYNHNPKVGSSSIISFHI